MKKGLRLFIILAAVVLVVGGGVGAIIHAQQGKTVNPERAMPDTVYQREDAEQTKLINDTPVKVDTTTSESGQKLLTYDKTDSYDPENPVDFYKDAENGHYRYDKNGRLIGYRDQNYEDDAASLPSGKAITQEQAIEIAYAKLKSVFGNVMDRMSLFNCRFSSMGSYKNQYRVAYVEYCGKDDFIEARTATCYVSLYGEIVSYTRRTSEEYETFDYARLEDLSEADLIAWTNERLIEDGLKPARLSDDKAEERGYVLYLEDGKIGVRISISHSAYPEMGERIYLYEFE